MAVMAGFALAVMEFPAKNLLFAFFVIGFSVPLDAVSVPLSAQIRVAGLANSYFGLALAGLGNGLAIYLLRQFFASIPAALSEAARIDGAGWLRIAFSMYLPLAKAPVTAAGLTLFVFQWQAFLWPLLVASDPRMQVGTGGAGEPGEPGGHRRFQPDVRRRRGAVHRAGRADAVAAALFRAVDFARSGITG